MQAPHSEMHELILKRIRDIPSLPEVVLRIMSLMSEPETPASEVARLISYDPGLTSRVLRMVNSAAYGFQRQISSIQHGIMILGFNTVRGLVLSAGILKLFQGRTAYNTSEHRKIWEHSIGVAVAARMLTRTLSISDMDDVFSAAMLHDIGKIVLAAHFSSRYHPLLREAGRAGLPFHGTAFLEMEAELLGVTHADIGHSLAVKWKLPVSMTEVIAHHHHPGNAQHCRTMAHVVALADEMAVLQQAHDGEYRREHFSPDVLAYFNLSDEDIVSLLAQLREEMGSVRDLTQGLT